jgi:hypothetical protein
MKEEERKRIEEDLKKLKLSDEEEYREWDLAMLSHTGIVKKTPLTMNIVAGTKNRQISLKKFSQYPLFS